MNESTYDYSQAVADMIHGQEPDNKPARPASRNESLLQAIDGIVWEADEQTFEFSYVSNKVKDILGYTPEEWLCTPGFWQEHIYHEDKEYAVNFSTAQVQLCRNHVLCYRMIKADGSIVWLKDMVSVISENGKPKWLSGIMFDITETKLLEDLDHLEKNALALSSQKGVNIAAVLEVYMLGMESLFPQMKCSIHSVRDNRLYDLSSPSLPPSYVAQLEGKEIGDNRGSCGTAAFLKEKVIVSDISTDARWTDYKQLALQYGLQACWSYPIVDSAGNAIAVFGIYYSSIKEPAEEEMAIIERSAGLLKVILENRLFAEKILEMNLMITQGQALAGFGNWQWEIDNNKVSWSDELFHIYGLDKHTFKATFEGYLGLLHPDDRERVKATITNALEAQKDFTFEERILRPDGELRHLRSWGRVVLNETGRPVKLIGACLDITLAKATETKMEEIAYLQSHVIRAPLARLMGLVNLLHEELKLNKEQEEILSNIAATSHELDSVIRSISSKTYL